MTKLLDLNNNLVFGAGISDHLVGRRTELFDVIRLDALGQWYGGSLLSGQRFISSGPFHWTACLVV
jgi:hypothetical protein